MGTFAVYDSNFFNTGLPYFNLECGKLLAFFRRNNQIATLSSTPSPDNFTEIIIRKEIEDGAFPSFFQSPACRFEGRAYTKFYAPMPIEIEETPPSFNDYERFAHLKEEEPFKLQKNALHLRLSLDEKTVWDNYEKPLDFQGKNTIFIHDKNIITIENSLEAIQELQTYRKQFYVSFLYPQNIYNIEDFTKWKNLLYGSDTYISLNFFPTTKELGIITKNLSSKIAFNLTGTALAPEEKYIDRISKFYALAMKLRSLGHKILLIYDDKKIGHLDLKYILPYLKLYFISDSPYSFYYYMLSQTNYTSLDIDEFKSNCRSIRKKSKYLYNWMKEIPSFYKGE
jgi:hypothetical protein